MLAIGWQSVPVAASAGLLNGPPARICFADHVRDGPVPLFLALRGNGIVMLPTFGLPPRACPDLLAAIPVFLVGTNAGEVMLSVGGRSLAGLLPKRRGDSRGIN